jgi:hypothetical protein
VNYWDTSHENIALIIKLKKKKNITHTALGFLNAASLSATAARSSPLLMQTAIFKIVLSLL